MPAFTPQPQGITALWLVGYELRLPTKECPGSVDGLEIILRTYLLTRLLTGWHG